MSISRWDSGSFTTLPAGVEKRKTLVSGASHTNNIDLALSQRVCYHSCLQELESTRHAVCCTCGVERHVQEVQVAHIGAAGAPRCSKEGSRVGAQRDTVTLSEDSTLQACRELPQRLELRACRHRQLPQALQSFASTSPVGQNGAT